MAEKISYKSIFKNKLSIACTGFASKPIHSGTDKQCIVFIAVNYKNKKAVVKKVFKKKKIKLIFFWKLKKI